MIKNDQQGYGACARCGKKWTTDHYWCSDCLFDWGWGEYARWLERQFHYYHSEYCRLQGILPPRKPIKE